VLATNPGIPRLVDVQYREPHGNRHQVTFGARFRWDFYSGYARDQERVFQWVIDRRELIEDRHWREVTFEEYSDLWEVLCLDCRPRPVPATLENVQRQFEIAIETYLRPPPPMAPPMANTNYEALVAAFRRIFFGPPPPPKSAEERARELLMSWLDPEQRKEFTKRAYFMVTGSAGGRYRIHPQNAYGVYKLNADDTVEAQYCFLPRGAHQTIGDIMLAQKISLETDEEGTLAIANRTNGCFGWTVDPQAAAQQVANAIIGEGDTVDHRNDFLIGG
jgi:hypothetical protein